MSLPYAYIIKFKPTCQYYIGIQWGNNCHPDNLWNNYFTSSKLIHGLIKKYSIHDFEIKIHKTFSSGYDARAWEDKILRRLRVVGNKKYLNQHDGINFEFRIGITGRKRVWNLIKNRWCFIFPDKFNPEIYEYRKFIRSKEANEKTSYSLKGRKKSKEHIEANRIAQLGKKRGTWEEQFGKEIADAMKIEASCRQLGKISPFKNKTYEEILGNEKAIELKKKRSEDFKKSKNWEKLKNKTYEEIHGIEKAAELKKTRGGKNRKIYRIYNENYSFNLKREFVDDFFNLFDSKRTNFKLEILKSNKLTILFDDIDQIKNLLN
jgi:hypothetical protein